MSLRSRHLAGLDGVRALAVVSVIVYHLGFGWARGGFLGVDLFFVLSGFLITSLLLEERIETGRLALVEFWRRRARRLLPALFVMLIVVMAVPLLASRLGHQSAVASIDVTQLRGFGFASFFYYANWFAISSGHSYFAALASPSPLAHTWSLAIEEQFYVLWPLLTVGLIAGGVTQHRRRGLWISTTIAVISTVLMAVLYDPASSSSANFVYNATFTRLFDLATGAALAWWVVDRPVVSSKKWAPDLLGALALLGFAVALVTAGDSSGVPQQFMFRGGFLLCAIAAAVLLWSVRNETSFVARFFALRPLRAIGRVSYGLYLWHWPVIIFVTPGSVGIAGKKLLLLRIVLMVVATYASYILLEKPIRERRWSVPWRRGIAGGGSIAALASVIVFTTPSLFPTASFASQVNRYAPSPVMALQSGVVGSLPNGWVAAGHFSRSNPIFVLVLGDSLPYVSRGGLIAALGSLDHVVIRVIAFPHLGMQNPVFRHYFLTRIRQIKPQIIIYEDFADQHFAATDPIDFHSTFSAFINSARSLGVQSFVIATIPPHGVANYAQWTPAYARTQLQQWRLDARTWQRAVDDISGHIGPGVAVLPTGKVLELRGKYSNWLPPMNQLSSPKSTWARVRMSDGIHMCPIGTEVFASTLIADLSQLLSIPSTGVRWWESKHLSEVVPGVPPNACPNDHP